MAAALALSADPREAAGLGARAAPAERIGPYRIVRELGRGGLGTVYLAARDDDQFAHRVAVKVVRPGMESEQVLRRLRRERQILAELDHPHIARLFDGGATTDGLPYFVMEAIDGERIDHWCAARQAPLRRRLELLRQVCDAVHYAHRRLVLHRDLKPSNILVSREGEPKLLDFGIAKLLAGEPEPGSSTSVLDDAFTLTASGDLPLTPEYASPEQLRGDSLTTASDVFSLGVVLYQLVTGSRPYAVDRRRLGDAERAIAAQEPPRASAAARRAPAAATPGWSPGPRGDDLDNILAMALRQEPARRYASAAELGEDLRRYLADLPVAARADTAFYRLGKFTRRHRWGVAAAAAFLVLLLATVGLTTWQARIAGQERARAEGVAGFLLELFAVADPYQSLGAKITAREMLDRGAVQMRGDPSLDADLRSSLLATMGKVYQNLSLYEPAAALLTEARTLARERFGKDDPQYLSRVIDLARLEQLRGRFAEADALLAEALAHPRLAADRQALLDVQRLKIAVATGLDHFAEAEAYFEKALATAGENWPAARAEVLDEAGLAWLRRQEPARAEPLLAEAVELRQRVFGPRHPRVADSRNDLGLALQNQGRLAAAEEQFRQSLAIFREALGERHYAVSVALLNLGWVRLYQNDLTEAEAFLDQALALRREIYGERHPAVADADHALARLNQMKGDLAAARGFASEALAIHREAYGERNFQTLRDLYLAADLAAAAGDPAGEELFTRLLATWRELAPADPMVATSLIGIGTARLAKGEAVAAEEPLREAVDLLRRAGRGEGDVMVAMANGQLAFCLERQGRAAEARELGGSALAVFAASFPASPKTGRLRALVERLDAASGVTGKAGRPPGD